MKIMLRKLRIQLTLLYLFASIILSLAVGGGTYTLVNYYFRTTTDQALWVKMGLQFGAYGIPLPLDLYNAVKQEGLVITNPAPTTDNSNPVVGGSDDGQMNPNSAHEHGEGLQESELADIFVLPLTQDGRLMADPGAQYSTKSINNEAVLVAEKKGYDFRTVKSANGLSIRLFTYLVPAGEKVSVIQIGRYLTGQQRVLQQLLKTLVLLGGLVTILFGLVSWYLAGRTIKPSQQAWDKQQTFIANASHELRAPLTLIHAGVELSLRKAQGSEQRELLSDVLSDANYMNKLIEDLLLLSRLDSGALRLDLQPIHLAEFTPEIFRQIERFANAQSITLSQSLDDLSLIADPIRLKQVLLIIFDNAIRNTPKGGKVHFEVKRAGDKAILSISDTGPGIPKELVEKVFERFYKVNDQSTMEYRGSGLGLSIAKGLVEVQHGSIGIKSLPGEGTQVSLTFPLV
jgi:signal transduction histidine kinase